MPQRVSVPIKHIQMIAVLLLVALTTGCSQAPAQTQAPAAQPSPTIASAQPALVPTPAPNQLVPTRGAPTRTPAPIATANPAVFNYLWPAYLPQGMVPAPRESRVARDNELGTVASGFFLVTFSMDGGKQKIILGGGAVDPLPLTGNTQQVTLDGRQATLISQGDQHLIRFVIPPDQGSLFLFGIGVSEQELRLTAESLLPITAADMRARVGQ